MKIINLRLPSLNLIDTIPLKLLKTIRKFSKSIKSWYALIFEKTLKQHKIVASNPSFIVSKPIAFIIK